MAAGGVCERGAAVVEMIVVFFGLLLLLFVLGAEGSSGNSSTVSSSSINPSAEDDGAGAGRCVAMCHSLSAAGTVLPQLGHMYGRARAAASHSELCAFFF